MTDLPALYLWGSPEDGEAATRLMGEKYAVHLVAPGTSPEPNGGSHVLCWPLNRADTFRAWHFGARCLVAGAEGAKVLEPKEPKPPGMFSTYGDWLAWAKPAAQVVNMPKSAPPQADAPPQDAHEEEPMLPLIVTDRGAPKPILANAIMLLTHRAEWEGVLAYDTFSLVAYAAKQPPIKAPPGQWTDIHDTLTTAWLQHNGVLVSTAVTAAAVEAVASRNERHPVREYLDGLRWDGVQRTEMWLSDFCGAHDSSYARAVARGFLIGAVARIFDPGCKVDTALIFEGPQGIGKSTAFNVLGGQWFTDDMSDMGSKDSKQEMQGVWIMELAELSSISRTEVEHVKSFITRKVDRFRVAYGRRVIERPRSAVFCGSTNSIEYLKDDENRRFLPVRVGSIDLPGLTAMRDQLWAEAVALYRQGARWWLEGQDLIGSAKDEQATRREHDAWESLMLNYCDGAPGSSPKADVSVEEFLEHAIGLPPERWEPIAQRRVARVLKHWGWERYQKRTGDTRKWRYRSPSTHFNQQSPENTGDSKNDGDRKMPL